MRNRRVTVSAGACLLLLPASGLAAPRPGSPPATRPHPLAWSGLLGCELVVVARYEGHEGRTALSLKVLRVLRGERARRGDVVRVSLKRKYTVETGHIGRDKWRQILEPDDTPKLCCTREVVRPGIWMPVKLVADVRGPALYFFDKEEAPSLKRDPQVQPACHAEGWRQALDGEEMDLLFRLTQGTVPAVRREAVEELRETRDGTTIEGLIRWAVDSPADLYFGEERVLAAIGDRDGDVYERAVGLLVEAAGAAEAGDWRRVVCLGRIMARADPDRALDRFERMLTEGPADLRPAAAWCVGYAGNERALDLAFELLDDAELARAAVHSLCVLLAPYDPRPRTWGEVAQLREKASARLLEALASPHLADRHRKTLRDRCGDAVGGRQRPPAGRE